MIDKETGIWLVNTGPSSTIHNASTLHKYDPGLARALVTFLANQSEIVDFGCGNADYSKIILENQPIFGGLKIQ